MRAQRSGFDEFALIIIAAMIFIGMLAIYWGSSGETTPKIFPREISINLQPSEKVSLSIKVQGNSANASVYAEGPIANFVRFSENNFEVYGEKEIKITITAPMTEGKYFGYIVAKTKEGEDRIEVRLTVSSKVMLKYRTLTIPDFSISNYGREKIFDSRENDFVERSVLKNKNIRLMLQLNESEVEEAYISIVVSDSKGPGDLFVYQNEELLFSRKIKIGELRVPLNLSSLRSINFITIEVSNPLWNIFGSTRYEIYQAKLVVKLKGTSYSFDLELDKDEIERFHSLEFSSVIQTSSPNLSFEIRINDQIAYRGKINVGVLRINMTRDILGEKFVLREKNMIKFSLVDEGYMNFNNNILKIYSRQ